MTAALTPPGVSPAQTGGPSGTPEPEPRASARVIAILAVALGAVLILGAVVSGVFSAVRAATQRTQTLTADAAGVADLEIDISSAQLTIVYGGDQVSLEVTGSAGDWRLTRDGDSLEVTTDRLWWGDWTLLGGDDTAVLTLPRALETRALDADFSVSNGVIGASGTYRELDLDLSAGSMNISGSAEAVDADISAGRLTFDLADVREADLQLSAGAVDGALTGRPPSETVIDVSAGRAELTLPDDTYAVSADVSAGTFDNRLSVDPTSRNRVSVAVSAGFAGLTS